MIRKSVIISNGDTLEWTRIDFNPFDQGGRLIKALLDFTISERNYDLRRKCWFIPSELSINFINGINHLINEGKLRFWTIEDRRENIESFDSFFTEEARTGVSSPKPVSKDELIDKFAILILSSTNTHLTLPKTEPTLTELKPFYRKAALALHPDRNNGDHSKMAELNVIWAQLQTLI